MVLLTSQTRTPFFNARTAQSATIAIGRLKQRWDSAMTRELVFVKSFGVTVTNIVTTALTNLRWIATSAKIRTKNSSDVFLRGRTGKKNSSNNLDNLICFRCLPIALKCNGVSNCDDWSDENPADCDDCKRPGLTKCDDSLICVRDQDVCDGVPHCLDKSDESDCKMVCDDVDTFRCEDESRCIPTSALCNGLNECLDASDETPEMCGEADTSGKFRWGDSTSSSYNNLFFCSVVQMGR